MASTSSSGGFWSRNTGVGPAFSLGGGLAAAVVGYLLTYLLTSGPIEDALSLPFDLGPDIATSTVVGWTFYGMHQVQIATSGSLGGFSGSGTASMAEAGFWQGWYVVVPPLVLAVLGLAVASQAETPDVQTGVLAGGSIVAGYLPVAVLGTFLFTYSSGGENVSFTAAPDLATAVILMGLVYPIVFGALGGGLGAWFSQRSTA